MPISAFRFEVKQLDDQGTFEGLASTYGPEPDQGGDVCVRGCFTDTLQQAGKQRPLLYGHRDPIGVVELTDSAQGLVARGKLTMAVQQAKDCYELMKSGALTGMSIGYQTLKEKYESGARQLLSLKLFEVSLVATPMNDAAIVTNVKSAQIEEEQWRLLKDFRQEIKTLLEKGTR